MAITVSGVVTNGVVIPALPLPEGAHVEIHLGNSCADMPPELENELAAWQQGSAEALALVERLADEEQPDEKR